MWGSTLRITHSLFEVKTFFHFFEIHRFTGLNLCKTFIYGMPKSQIDEHLFTGTYTTCL